MADIPVFLNMEVIDKETNMFMGPMRQIFDQLFRQLQQNIGPEGYVVPELTTAQIALLTKSKNGTLIYNSDTDELMVRKAGVFENVLTT